MTQPTQTVAQVGNRTLTDRSGTCAGVANTSTAVMAANPNRDGFYVHNPNAAGSLFVSEIGATASSATPIGMIKIGPGGTYFPRDGGVSPSAINIASDTVSLVYTAREW